MPSVLPSFANDYQFPPAPNRAALDRALWNAVMASLASRLRALEDVNSGIEAIQAQLQSLGLTILDAAINPLIADTQAQLADLAEAVAQTIAQNAQIIESFQGETAAAMAALDATIAAAIADLNDQIASAVSTLNAQIDDVEQQVAAILDGGIPAVNVAEDESRVFVTAAQRAEIGQLRADLGAWALHGAAELQAVETVLGLAIDALEAGGAMRVVAVNTTAIAGERLRVKSMGGTLTVTLPPAPQEGNLVEIWRDGPQPVVIARNGQTILGVADNLQMNTDKTIALLTYSDGTWTVQRGRYASNA